MISLVEDDEYLNTFSTFGNINEIKWKANPRVDRIYYIMGNT